jgi:hypothetical protein
MLITRALDSAAIGIASEGAEAAAETVTEPARRTGLHVSGLVLGADVASQARGAAETTKGAGNSQVVLIRQAAAFERIYRKANQLAMGIKTQGCIKLYRNSGSASRRYHYCS